MILIVVIINLINKKNIENSKEYSSYKNNADQNGINYEIKEVTNPTHYYTVYDCFENYVRFISLTFEDNIQDEYIEGGEISQSILSGIYSEEQKREAIYNILDTSYILDNNININNIYQFVDSFNKETFKINKMYTQDGERLKYYLLYVLLDDIEDEKCYLITLDTNNMSYMIKPQQYIKPENISKEVFMSKITEIKSNNNNSFEYNRVSDEDMAKKYFYSYKNYIFDNIEYAFSKLEKEYREKRFSDIYDYEKYINNNKRELEDITIVKYLVNSNKDYIEYICKDQYDNIYIFNVIAVMNYSVKLDNYTVTTEKFSKTYETATDTDKVLMNIDKWRQMLNNRDYKKAYSVLDETFRNNNFDSEENFESYIKHNFPSHYKIEYEETSVQSGLYIQKVIFKDILNEDVESIEKTIIMKLNEGTNFEMSFNIE